MASAILCINAKLTGLGLSLLLLRRGGTLCAHPATPPAAALRGLPARFHPVGRRGLRLQSLRDQYRASRAIRSIPGWEPPPIPATPREDKTRMSFRNAQQHDGPQSLRPVLLRPYSAIPGRRHFMMENHARLMWPFNVALERFRWSSASTRCAFRASARSSAARFSSALVLLGVALVRPGMPREIVVLLAGAVVASLLVGVHTWWARYGPQLWWLPIIAVIAGLAVPGWRAVRWTAWGLAALLLVNAVAGGGGPFPLGDRRHAHHPRADGFAAAEGRGRGRLSVFPRAFR